MTREGNTTANSAFIDDIQRHVRESRAVSRAERWRQFCFNPLIIPPCHVPSGGAASASSAIRVYKRKARPLKLIHGFLPRFNRLLVKLQHQSPFTSHKTSCVSTKTTSTAKEKNKKSGEEKEEKKNMQTCSKFCGMMRNLMNTQPYHP